MKKGFTLIEMLVVIFIMGILSSIALPKYQRSVERARVSEAQTLLRSIFESQERLLWERGFNSYKEALNKNQAFGFDKLDITVKGTYEKSLNTGVNTGTLRTENFTYEMYFSGNDIVEATSIKGKYTGAKIVYDGAQFTCTDDEAPGACAAWGENTWNQL